MTDRELLEKAAKAAGLAIEYWAQPNYPIVRNIDGHRVGWDPLTFDADALRLAVKLEMDVFVRTDRWTEAVAPMGRVQKEPHGTGNALAATRRAIVRAAAEMGK